MKRFIQLLFLVALSMYNAIQTVTGGATLKKLAPSGVINQGILGGFSGKVGPVVGGKWKDIDYMRSYVIPANPNSTAQQAVRAKFAALVALARQILAGTLQIFWDPFYSNMSGFNAWISQNYANASAAGVIDETAIMMKGTLQGVEDLAATYDNANGDVDATWTDNTGVGDALGTDKFSMIVLDETGQILHQEYGIATRADEAFTGSIPSGLTATAVIAFGFFIQGAGAELSVSDSTSAICTAA